MIPSPLLELAISTLSFDYAAINFPTLGLIHEFSIGLGIK